MKKRWLIFGLMFSLAGAIAATNALDITGKWSGTIDVKDESSGTNITTPVQVQFQQRDAAISGNIGRAEDNDLVPIKNAKVEGNKIYFEASSGETLGPAKFNLIVDGDHMEGEMKTSVDTGDITGKVKISRQK